MPAYSFKERFIPLIKSGLKKQTIRKKRKGQAKPGDTVYLYYGMRTKWCTKIGEAICTDTKDITITKDSLLIDNIKVSKKQCEVLAKADGFESFEIMMHWWNQTHQLPFNGDIIYWNELKNSHA
ncbi:MAG: hypothetical protein C0459_03315 [Chitinophaga sp.]|jgi:hypothetical protein|nr:hypothetical protein [Chitinophaga sp.]